MSCIYGKKIKLLLKKVKILEESGGQGGGQNYVTVQATSQTTAATDVLPASGLASDTIYRVSNWDGSANNGAGGFDVTKYSEYTWDDVSNPNKYVFLCVNTTIGEVFDISVYNNNAKYADLTAALGTNGANVPVEIRRGGMSIKFVQSNDNNYVKFFCTADEFTTDVTQWQGVDDEPIAGSKNLITSNGTTNALLNAEVKAGQISFTQGYIEENGNINTSLKYRLVSDYIKQDGRFFELLLETGYTLYRVAYYDSNKVLLGTAQTAALYREGCAYFKICIKRTGRESTEPLNPLGKYIRSTYYRYKEDEVRKELYQGYRDATPHGLTNRVSSYLINCRTRNITIYTYNGIQITNIGKYNGSTQEYISYETLSSPVTQKILEVGYRYEVVFKKSDNSNITPDDVYTNVIIEEDGMFSYINAYITSNNNRLTTIESSVKTIREQAILDTITYQQSDFTKGRWYTGNVGDVITENTGGSYASSYSIKIPIESLHRQYIVVGKGTASPLWATIDSNNVIKRRSGNNATSDVLTPQDGEVYLIVQTNNSSSNPGSVTITLNSLDNRLNDLERYPKNNFKGKSRFSEISLAKLLATNSGFVNIGFLGDSWTQGTENTIGGVTNGYAGYVEVIATKMWEQYGFGGLGWLDFGFDNGDKTRKMFGCADLYKHWSYTVTGDVTGLDGSSGSSASQCLGICCAHTTFNNGSVLSLTFNTGYLDKFKIRYYKDAHFTVSVNGGSAVEITANSTDGWQETELGVTGTDTTSVVITSLADGSIIFGMDCFYGSKGVRIHKIGNRSISATGYLAQDAAQWETGVGLLNLCSLSLLFGINDLGTQGKKLSYILGIVDRINTLIERAKVPYTETVSGNNIVVCDLNVLAINSIEITGKEGLPILADRFKTYALQHGYGYVCTKDSIGESRDEFIYTGIFSDAIHLNSIGSKSFGENILNSLFGL